MSRLAIYRLAWTKICDTSGQQLKPIKGDENVGSLISAFERLNHSDHQGCGETRKQIYSLLIRGKQ